MGCFAPKVAFVPVAQMGSWLHSNQKWVFGEAMPTLQIFTGNTQTLSAILRKQTSGISKLTTCYHTRCFIWPNLVFTLGHWNGLSCEWSIKLGSWYQISWTLLRLETCKMDRCPGNSCKGTPNYSGDDVGNAACLNGTMGPVCAVCDNNYYLFSGQCSYALTMLVHWTDPQFKNLCILLLHQVYGPSKLWRHCFKYPILDYTAFSIHF